MFEIDIITLIMAVAGMVAFAIPFYLNSQKVKKEKAQKSNKLTEFLKNHDLSLSEQEEWRNRYFIGIDTQKNKLIYISNLNEINPILIDLYKVNHVKIHEVSRVIGTKGNSRKIIDALSLQLINYDGKIIGDLEFYDGEIFSDLVGEPIIIKKWEATLQSLVKNQQKNNRIAI
ncbi:hypothetical protein [Belliella aquatica]|uniref:Uncharacterized protein n=1 Tax=Belliella aquatica TaxID=1323734 RepID=A0ABQ1LTY0_9BACT|nr:hypothetical protein [Belliella aquatica]MCH7407262.1 hypothetical protein [Belliella aquatica]GGC29390.1 hypothetical protein GCM10010993_05330 [Belliella aquatica]